MDPRTGLAFRGVLTIVIGTIAPPVGTIMYVVLALSNISIAEFAREVWPFILALVAALLFVTYPPELALWLPNLVLPVR